MSENQQNLDKPKPLHSIIFCGGEKGGVGKSFFGRCLLDYFIAKGWDDQFLLIEADPNISDVSEVYKDSKKQNCKEIVFSDNKFNHDEPNIIIEKVQEKSTIVNLPSNISLQFDDWTHRIGVFSDEIRPYYNNAYYFFVSDGCHKSIQQFLQHLDKYGHTNLINCLVLNLGRLTCGGNFNYLAKESSLMSKLKQSKIPVIALPELTSSMQYQCDREGLSYSDFMNREGANIVEKSTMKRFIIQLDRLFSKIFPNNVANAEGLEEIARQQANRLNSDKFNIGSKDSRTRVTELF